jgi:ribosomal protein L13E
MTWQLERYRILRRRSLKRMRKLRELHAPTAVVRREKLFMWGIRQWRQHPDFRGLSLAELPGMARNEARFLGIYGPPANPRSQPI